MTRAEHLEWAKQRANQYIERGSGYDAFKSMCSDLAKHDELKDHIGIQIGNIIVLSKGFDLFEIKNWIDGFN